MTHAVIACRKIIGNFREKLRSFGGCVNMKNLINKSLLKGPQYLPTCGNAALLANISG